MAKIPENKIDEVRMAADIIDVIGSYVNLKRRGRNHIALCPFHTEKTPSFTVSPDKQIYHCFGCGKGGNVFTFLMEHENISFVEAVKLLADRYGIILPKYRPEHDERTERLLYANHTAAEFFQSCLKQQSYRSKIEPYLYEKRQLSPRTVEMFQIGLAPDEWDGLIKYARKKDITPQELVEAGLAIESDKSDRIYDRFRLRLMIPIYNLSGKIVGFGGRALRKGEQAKYINSPETSVYNKSNNLYGLNFGRDAIRENGTVILVEGYFDFISLFQAGIKNAAAVSGTAFTEQQARLLSRFAYKAFLFFDADSAGRHAALRSVEYFYNFGIEPFIVSSPPGTDPDSIVQEQGSEGISKLINDAIPYLDFRFKDFNLSAMTMREKESIAYEVKSIASRISDDTNRDIFISAAADKLGIDSMKIRSSYYGKLLEKSIPESFRGLNILEAEFLSLILSKPMLVERVWNDIAPEDLRGPGHQVIYSKMIELYRENGKIDADRLIKGITDPSIGSALTLIATLDLGDIDHSNIIKEYRQMLLKQKRRDKLIRLKKQLVEAEKGGDSKLAEKLAKEINYLLVKER